MVRAFVTAARRLIDPHRLVLADDAPYLVTRGSALDHGALIAHARGADAVDADLVHLAFAPGREMEGLVCVMTGSARGNVVHLHRDCRFWTDAHGTPFLVARHGAKTVTLTFDADGMDAHPGWPTASLDAGYARANRRLVALAQEALATQDAAAA